MKPSKRSFLMCAKHFLNLIQVFPGFHVRVKLQLACSDENTNQVQLFKVTYDRVHGTFQLEKGYSNGAYSMAFSKHPMKWFRALDVRAVKRIRLEGMPVPMEQLVGWSV